MTVDREIINKFAALKSLNVRDSVITRGGVEVSCVNDSKEFRDARINEIKKLCDILGYKYVNVPCTYLGFDESAITILSGCTYILTKGARRGEICGRICNEGNLCALCLTRERGKINGVLKDIRCANECDAEGKRCINASIYGGYCLKCLSIE